MQDITKKIKAIEKKLKVKEITLEQHGEIFDELIKIEMEDVQQIFDGLRDKLNAIEIAEPQVEVEFVADEEKEPKSK